MVYRIATSANVLPIQILFPPKNGVKAKGFLGLPSVVKVHSFSLVSNRLGSKRLGSFHYTGS